MGYRLAIDAAVSHPWDMYVLGAFPPSTAFVVVALAAIGCATSNPDSPVDTDGGSASTAVGSSSSTDDADHGSSSSTTGPGGGTTTDPSTTASETSGPGDDTGPDAPPMGTACGSASVYEPGRITGITVDVDGVERSYDLFVPPGYHRDVATPLVVNFHGLLGSPTQQADFSQFDAAATAHDMIVAYPAGIGASFNAGACCGQASSNDVDDVGFARALVADVESKTCVDPKRVYAIGMSNGGHMAHRLACEAADVFAAAASVTGVLSLVAPCAPARPISMVQYHGTADTIVSYDGVPSVVTMMEAWAARNGCSSTPATTFEQGDMHCQTWPDCDAGVEVSLCTVEDGGHCWPGNASCIFGHSSTELHASEEIASMFDAQPMP